VNAWRTASLGEIFDIARGGSPRPIQDYITYAPNGVNWISISDASASDKFIIETKKRIRPEGVSRSRMVKPGDFLLTNSMSFGRPYIMGTSGCIHDGWLVLSSKRDQVDQDYFFHLLGSDFIYAKFTKLAAGATVKNLNIDLVSGVEVSFPPLDEQRRIAAILDQAETLRTQRRQALAHLDTLTQSLFLDMFGDPVTNPKGWALVRLDELVRAGDTINYGVIQPGDALDEGVPLVRVGDVVDRNFDPSALKRIDPTIEAAYKRSRLRGDEILVTCVGSIGVVALVDSSMTGFNIARAVSRIPASDKVDRVFLASYLQTEHVQRYFTSELRTVSQPTLNIKQICETKVIQPPLHFQQTFATRMQAIESLKATHRAALAQLDALFASLQQRAFAGEL